MDKGKKDWVIKELTPDEQSAVNNFSFRLYSGIAGYDYPDSNIGYYTNEAYQIDEIYSVIQKIMNGANDLDLVVKDMNGDIVENIPTDLASLMKVPFSQMKDEFYFREVWMLNLLLTGEIPVEKVFESRVVSSGNFKGAKPTSLRIIPPQVFVVKYQTTQSGIIDYYTGISTADKLPEEAVIFKVLPSPDYPKDYYVRGWSPLRSALRKAEALKNSDNLRNTMYGNIGSDVVITPKEQQQSFEPEQAENARNSVERNLNNQKRAGKASVLAMPIDVHKISHAVKDLQLVENGKYLLEGMANIYGVPIVLLDPEKSSLNNMKEARKMLYDDAIMPKFKLYTDFWTEIVQLWNPNWIVEADTSNVGALQADKDQLSTWATRTPLMVDEYRALMGQPPLGGEAGQTIILNNMPFNLDFSNQDEVEKARKAIKEMLD